MRGFSKFKTDLSHIVQAKQINEPNYTLREAETHIPNLAQMLVTSIDY